MNYSAEQVVNGIIKYADNEIMVKLPTTGKWVFGTAVNLASNRIDNLIESLMNNAIINMLGIVDEDGNIDIDALVNAMKQSADKYGRISFDVPMIGKMTFSSNDIDSLRTYIM